MSANEAGKTSVSLAEHPLQIVCACRARDLPVFELTADRLQKLVPFARLNVFAPDRDCATIASRIGKNVNVIAEGDAIPGVTIERLRELKLQGFPQAAGWYLQQLLKLQFARMSQEDDYYLIWDADTVPLRPMKFFDEAGKMLLTKAHEFHPLYFETYRTLLHSEPNREFSFIAQHIIVQKSVAREMMCRIEENLPGNESWAWKLMKALPTTGKNLFSEYETYGHYIKNHYPDRVAFVERAWQRSMTHYTGRPIPTEHELQELARRYDYAAFERAYSGWRRIAYRWWNQIRGCSQTKKLPGAYDTASEG
jgi:hypothetical protein